jgi:hypothetical protein
MNTYQTHEVCSLGSEGFERKVWERTRIRKNKVERALPRAQIPCNVVMIC